MEFYLLKRSCNKVKLKLLKLLYSVESTRAELNTVVTAGSSYHTTEQTELMCIKAAQINLHDEYYIQLSSPACCYRVKSKVTIANIN